MTNKAVINEHFSKTAEVWRDKIYKSRKKQGLFEYYDKQYRFDYVVEMIPPAKNNGQRALDMGCGAGQLIPILAGKGYQVCGIDISSRMVEISKQICKDCKIEADIKTGDCENLNYQDNSFDVYTAMGVIEYMDRDEPMFEEMRRVLCPGGVAIITIRNNQSIHIRWRVIYTKFFEHKIKNFIKRILGRETKPYRIISKEHNPKELKKKLVSLGFEILDECYAHFHVLPAPTDRLLWCLEAIMGKAMEKHLSRSKGAFLASSYIVKVKKPTK